MIVIKKIIITVFIIYITSSLAFATYAMVKSSPISVVDSQTLEAIYESANTTKQENVEKDIIDIPNNGKSITISSAGDCTLGSDDSYSYVHSFIDEFHKNNEDYGYFMKNVSDIFSKDDLTIVNLESPLTDSDIKSDKQFNFKGYPSFTNILKEGNIEAVDIANNHTKDYLEKGLQDTIDNLDNAGIGYFGYNYDYITTIKDIKIGLLGYKGWTKSKYQLKQIKSGIDKLKESGCDIVIVSFHWGDEGSNYPNDIQTTLGRYTIDQGADLVLGHHPHVIQGIEEYQGKYIVYSLGNFSFGGNKYGKDKDTFIFQQTFNYNDDNELEDTSINIIPCSVSSISNRNNFQPTPLEDTEKDRVLDRINKYSRDLKFNYE